MYYGKEYYDSCDELRWATESAPVIALDVIGAFHPETVIDVGCGSGDYLDAFRKHGVKVFGVELAEAALTRCREKGLDVVPVDLTKANELPWRADVVCSFEVAEHVRESGARNFVRLITSSAREHVVLTAAQPGQPGLGHITDRRAKKVKLFLVESWDGIQRRRALQLARMAEVACGATEARRLVSAEHRRSSWRLRGNREQVACTRRGRWHRVPLGSSETGASLGTFARAAGSDPRAIAP
jgi:SAM-dependent methyltransferase